MKKFSLLLLLFSLFVNFSYAQNDYNYWFQLGYNATTPQEKIHYYNKSIELYSGETWAFNNRGYAKFKLGDFQGAIADYNNAIQLDPQNAIVLKNRADAKMSIRDYIRPFKFKYIFRKGNM